MNNAHWRVPHLTNSIPVSLPENMCRIYVQAKSLLNNLQPVDKYTMKIKIQNGQVFKLTCRNIGSLLLLLFCCYLLSITAATHHPMQLTQWKRQHGWLAVHIEYQLCKCSLMLKTDRGAEGKRGTINQHLSELPHLV